VERYKKPIIIAETAHAWRKTADGFIGEQQEKIAGFPATPEAQRKVIDLVMNITASLKEDMGLGIYYWEPVVIPIKGEGGWASNMGIFDEEGKALPALECFKFDRSQFKPKEIAKIYEPGKVLAEIGKEVMLPRTVRVLYYDGSCPEIPVEWKTFDNSKAGNIVVEGFLAKINEYVSITIELVEKLKEDYNFIANGDFEEGLTGWEVEASDDRIKIELHPEFIDPFPAPPVNYLYIESPVNFTLDLTKELKGLVPGEYNLQVEYRGTNTTGVDVKLFAETNEKQWETIIYPTDEDWTLYQISNIMVGNGGIKLGLKLSSPPVFGKIRRFQLTRNT
jgi:arabinogalactan endo-1,4-beta-galactosidase